jgi:N-acetylglutamate synthase-like GNAT family acetyltransferase
MSMQRTVTLRPARVDEAEALSALTRRSKQSHGYSDEFMARFMSVGDMVITPESISQNPVMVAEIDGRVAGFAHLKPLDHPDAVCLEDLFIEPDAQGQGVGRVLFDWALATAAERGYDWLEWESDPNAAGFYEKMGGEKIGETKSTLIEGRVLPAYRMRVKG